MDTTKQTPEEVVNTEVEGETETDALIKELETVRAERDKIASDRDNYRAALLTSKKSRNDYSDPDEEERVNARVREELEAQTRRTLEEKERQIVEKLAQENKRLKETVVALQNKPQKSAIASGGSAEIDVQTDFFSDSQIQLLTQKAKQLGKDPKEFISSVKQNYIQSKR